MSVGVLRRAGVSVAEGLRKLAHALDPKPVYGPKQARANADALRRITGVQDFPVAMVLGSGYPKVLDRMVDDGATRHRMADLPHMPLPANRGHSKDFLSYPVGPGHVLVYGGRVHGYEGHTFDELVMATRSAVLAGAKIVFLANAAGGAEYGPGSFVFIEDALWRDSGVRMFPTHHTDFGPRHVDPNGMFDSQLVELMMDSAQQVNQDPGVAFKYGTGVYNAYSGSEYETARYVRMLRADDVTLFGMSTAPSALAAHAMGARVVAMSTVTNWAAGTNPDPSAQITHDEVTEVLATASDNFFLLLEQALPKLMEQAQRP